jgi:osmotically-inducible protein OsmY
MEDKRLSGQSIEITASNGYIQVLGTVNTDEDRQLAIQLAQGVPGVRYVEDRLELREISDDEE